MKRKIFSFVNVLTLLGFAPSAIYGYANNSPNGLKKANFIMVPTTESKNGVMQSSKYDLGLGKNPPFVKSNKAPPTKFGGFENDTYRAMRHMTEHQAVRPIPSPLSQPQQPPKLQVSYSIKRKHKPTIDYSRRSEDVLHIFEEKSEESGDDQVPRSSRGPLTIVAKTHGQKLDMNTAWVEMLLHSESSKGVGRKS